MDKNKEMVETLVKEKDAQKEMIEELQSTVRAFEDLGSPSEISEALDRMNKVLESLKDINLETVNEDLVELESYRKLGQLEELEPVMSEAIEVIEAYQELGSPETISEALSKLEETVVADKCEALGVRFNFKTETINKMYNKVGDFEVVESLLQDIATSDNSVNEGDDTDTDNYGKRTPLNEDNNAGSMVKRLSGSLSGRVK